MNLYQFKRILSVTRTKEHKKIVTPISNESGLGQKFWIAVIGGLVGSILTATINLYITSKTVETTKSAFTGTNLQRDKELLIQQLFSISECYVKISDQLLEDSSKFDIYSLVNVFEEQRRLSERLGVCAPSEICQKTSLLNQSLLAILQDLNKRPKPIAFSVRREQLFKYVSDYYAWLAFVRMKLSQLNITTMPQMGDSTFLDEFRRFNRLSSKSHIVR